MKHYSEFTDEQVSVIRPVLRQVFANANGPEALAIILKATGFFDRADNEEQVALRNFAVWLLEQIGLNQDHNFERLMRAWLAIPAEPPEQEEVNNG